MEEIRIHGYGGQGAVTLALLTAMVAAEEGMQVQTLPFFGVERRGAPVKAAVRLSQEEILIRSQVAKPQVLVVMSETLLQRALDEGFDENGWILLNATHKPDLPYQVKCVDATAIALQLGLVKDDVPFINVPLLGMVCAHLQLPQATVEKAICEKWSGKVAEKNCQAVALAYQMLKQEEQA